MATEPASDRAVETWDKDGSVGGGSAGQRPHPHSHGDETKTLSRNDEITDHSS